jgi:predicted ATPase
MGHTLELKHFGPVDGCMLSVEKFTVFTGPQSNGKSTVAKAIYYFRTVKQDILNVMMQGGPKKVSGNVGETWSHILQQRMQEKFLQLFGTSQIMPEDMSMTYNYQQGVSIRVYLAHTSETGKNYVAFSFSDTLVNYLNDLESHSFENITPVQKESEEQVLAQLLDDPYETVFIPAGRNLITLLSTQLNYIFTSLEGTQLRNIDYVTKRYTELILKLKPLFQDGMAGLMQEALQPLKHKAELSLLCKIAEQVLHGRYQYVDGEERLYLDAKRYVKINFASSGQQEIVWVFNLLFYYLYENRKVFVILEEPESHLYPDSQQRIGEALGLFLGAGNAVLVTTHSPYLLGTFNYMLLAAQCPEMIENQIKARLRKQFWISPNAASAYYIREGKMSPAMVTDDGLTMIQNELIDDASEQINDMSNFIVDQFYTLENDHGQD